MAVLKIACPRCGQRVSGDESFYGTSVDCPVCSSKIVFPDKPIPPRDPGDIGESRKPEPPAVPENAALEDDSISENLPKVETSSIPLDPAPPAGIRGEPTENEGGDVPSPLLGILSMVAGILNAFTGCMLAIVLAPLGIILGHLALAQSKYSKVQPAPGRGMAIAGVILGYLGMVVLLILLVLVATGIIELPFGKEDENALPVIE